MIKTWHERCEVYKGIVTHRMVMDKMLEEIDELRQALAQQKKEWVGLTDHEARKFYEKYTNREELIYAIDEFLEEKNK